MATVSVPTPEPAQGLERVPVAPPEIVPGDWMKDLGRLRQVVSVQPVDDRIPAATLVRFADGADGDFPTLTIPADVTVTVWRAARHPCGVARV
jgi:hypothetical protein